MALRSAGEVQQGGWGSDPSSTWVPRCATALCLSIPSAQGVSVSSEVMALGKGSCVFFFFKCTCGYSNKLLWTNGIELISESN